MESQEEKKVEKTWKPMVGGILAIIAGIIGCIGGIGIAVLGGVAGGILSVIGLGGLGGVVVVVGVIVLILGIIAIVGGVNSMRRKSWGLALAGSICAVFCPGPFAIPTILGILAIIFVAIGKGEFR